MANFDEKPTSTSSASTLEEGGGADGSKERGRDEDLEHAEDGGSSPALPPMAVKDEGARSEMLGRMDQTALNAMLENPLVSQI